MEVLDDIDDVVPVTNPRLRDLHNPLEWYSDEEFYRHFRFTKDTTLFLIDKLKNKLERPTRRHHALTCVGLQQVCVTFLFYSTANNC